MRWPRITRRSLLSALSALPFLPNAASAKPSARSRNHARLWYKQPATIWEEALPVGNGRLGAMVFGRVGQERLQLNEDTFWAGRPYTPDNPDALAALPEVRRLIEERRFKEATELAAAKMMARPLRQMPYSTLGDLFLNFDKREAPRSYERELDLASAIASTRYSTGKGTIRREVFASAPDQVIAVRLEATANERISFVLTYRGPTQHEFAGADYKGSEGGLVHAHGPNWLLTEADEDKTGAKVELEGSNEFLITGRNTSTDGIASGLTYTLRGKIVTDGRVGRDGGIISVAGARKVTLLLAAATSFKRYDDVSGDPAALVRERIRRAGGRSYDALKQAHIRDHHELFGRFAIDLGQTPAETLPTDERVRRMAANSAADPALPALYVQFARYLLISSSRPGTQPANLQGIWNPGTNPPWGSKYTININTEMNYWPADPANLGLTFEPLVRMVEELAVRGAATARRTYGARGWVAHHNTDLWRAAAPIDGPQWGLWPCGGAWLCNTLWRHYSYSPSETLLRRLYPLMKGASQFFLDFLTEDPGGRGLITSPSLSPENQHPFGSSVCAGPACDRQILRDLFQNTVDAGRRLGLDHDFLEKVAATSKRLAPDRIGKSGQLQEWLEDWDDAAPEPQHRHVSHLYAVYPSSQINVRDTPELAQAARLSLTRRGDLATGWATAWRAALWARLGDGNHAHKILTGLLGPTRTYPNLFDAHPPFQIDGNFGGTAAILEMLLQSWGGEIRPLAALPRAWPNGSVRGLRAEGGVSVDMEWRDGQLTSLLLVGRPNAVHKIRYAGRLREARLDRRGAYRWTAKG
jgi:alpha-L-fucosidase 2